MKRSLRRRARRGFTLPEAMAVVAIMALLALVALPSFSDALRRSRRAEGTTALGLAQLAQERWRADHAAYADKLAALGLPSTTASGFYVLAIDASDAEGYVMSATAVGAQADDQHCKTLRLSQRNGRLSQTSIDGNGNEAARPNPCWNP